MSRQGFFQEALNTGKVNYSVVRSVHEHSRSHTWHHHVLSHTFICKHTATHVIVSSHSYAIHKAAHSLVHSYEHWCPHIFTLTPHALRATHSCTQTCVNTHFGIRASSQYTIKELHAHIFMHMCEHTFNHTHTSSQSHDHTFMHTRRTLHTLWCSHLCTAY